MKLKQVLKIHSSVQYKSSLPTVLGDAYLLKYNMIYRRIREMALDHGYRYKPAWELYQKASLYELQTILKKKIIPFNVSVPTLKYISDKYKVNEDIDNVPVNLLSYHFHESAHGISNEVFKTTRPKNKKEKILFALLCESYANATESMAITYVNKAAQKFFFEQNSYIYVNTNRTLQRQRAIEKWGPEGLFRLLWISYLYSNFLVDDMPKKELEGLLRFALGLNQLSSVDIKLGTSLFTDAYELNEKFRMKTAQLYLHQLGLKGNVRKNLAFDFVYLFLKHKGFANGFQKLSQSTILGIF